MLSEWAPSCKELLGSTGELVNILSSETKGVGNKTLFRKAGGACELLLPRVRAMATIFSQE